MSIICIVTKRAICSFILRQHQEAQECYQAFVRLPQDALRRLPHEKDSMKNAMRNGRNVLNDPFDSLLLEWSHGNSLGIAPADLHWGKMALCSLFRSQNTRRRRVLLADVGRVALHQRDSTNLFY
jgi:hypothetical protein